MKARALAFGSLLLPVVVALACGEDEATVRDTPDSGTSDGGGETGPTSPCGVAIPSTYESPQYETNAAAELALRNSFRAYQMPMVDVETSLAPDGGTRPPVSKAQVVALWQAGNPSVRSISSAYLVGRTDAWLTQYEAAGTGTWTPAEPPPATGGAYGRWVLGPTGFDLRQGTEKAAYGGAFYFYAVSLVTAGGLTAGTVDRLVAIFGAHPSFPNNPTAPTNPDVFAAAYAARRDAKDPGNLGPYQKIKRALIVAKATITAGETCNADRDAAFRVFFEEWEKSSYATAVFYLNDTQARLGANTLEQRQAALHAYGEALSIMIGFKAVVSPYRKITDAQIDDLLTTGYYPEGQPGEIYKLVTNSAAAVLKLGEMITKIKTVYGFTDAEINAFKTDF